MENKTDANKALSISQDLSIGEMRMIAYYRSLSPCCQKLFYEMANAIATSNKNKQ